MKKLSPFLCTYILTLFFTIGLYAQTYLTKISSLNTVQNKIKNIILLDSLNQELKITENYVFTYDQDSVPMISSCTETTGNDRFKYEYVYDSNKNILNYTLSLNIGNTFIPVYQEIRTYSSLTDKIQTETFIRESPADSMHTKIEKTYVQFTVDVINLIENTSWDKPIWWEDSKLSSMTVFQKRNDSNNWEVIRKIEYDYKLYDFSPGNISAKIPLLESLSSFCSEDGNPLKRTSLITYSYSGDINSRADKFWDIYHGYFDEERIYACNGTEQKLCMITQTPVSERSYIQNSKGIIEKNCYKIKYYDNDTLLFQSGKHGGTEIIKYTNTQEESNFIGLNLWTRETDNEANSNPQFIDKISRKNNTLTIYNKQLEEGNPEFMPLKAFSAWSDGWIRSGNKDTYSAYKSILERNTSRQKLWTIEVNYEKEWPPIADKDKVLFYPDRKYTVFPNPVEEQLFFTSPEEFHAIRYSICDVTGKIKTKGIVSSREEAIPVQHLPAGTYIFLFSNEKEAGSIVFIKK